MYNIIYIYVYKVLKFQNKKKLTYMFASKHVKTHAPNPPSES
jgi:hypothetical protein